MTTAVTTAETTAETPAPDDRGETAPDDRSATAQAWLVTLVIGAALVAVVVIMAFSQNNTPASIDGRTATTSQFVGEGDAGR